MRVPVPSEELQSLGLAGVEKLLAKLWINFLSAEEGLHSEVLADIYQTIYPLGLWDANLLMSIAAPRPNLMPQLKPKAASLSLNTPSYQEVLNHILKITELNEIFFGKFQIKRPQLEELINPNGCLSGSVISGFLHFYTEDIVAFQELPGLPPPFYIMDVLKTSVMASQSTIGIFKPKLNMKTSRLYTPV
ncbi:hypothetical protein M422DRAFT_264845 [Sphaerobolus stellatus SS14]|uniref:Uncharacterized protein n=1 Tax=Sphaerobolus stellatus (strain SS14) TaxID=990650 RepID=A0A0C9V7F5_SPHS4|nr:hypothetical protein M422DRAFT_264845 [Sphaerobolus stellatus SS14]